MLALAVCALAVLAGNVSADTLRSALYQFEIPASQVLGSRPAPADQGVYMRVSNALGIISDPASPLAPAAGEATDGVALFEFFVGGDSPGLSLSEVRLLQHRMPSESLATLKAVLSLDRSRNARSTLLSTRRPCSGLGGRNLNREFVIDVRSIGCTGGTASGGVIGLMFELGPGETIDTLIDGRLARGELLPQVQVAGPADTAPRCAASVDRVDSEPRNPRPDGGLRAAKADVAVSTAPVRSPAVVDRWTPLEPDGTGRPSAEQLDRKVATRLSCGMRAREPPLRTA